LSRISDDALDQQMAQADREARSLGDAFIRYCLGPDVLGEVYKCVPAESLLVSDMVPVDFKVALFADIMPGLARRVERGEGEEALRRWLGDRLGPLGEDGRSLMQDAPVAWLKRAAREGKFGTEVLGRVAQLLDD
jgi:hypothetical protein